MEKIIKLIPKITSITKNMLPIEQEHTEIVSETKVITEAQKIILVAGPKGDVGKQGPKGDVGKQGPKGDVGKQGPKGDVGKQGETPEHEWIGESLRFRDSKGEWGSLVDLSAAKDTFIPAGSKGPGGFVSDNGFVITGQRGKTGPNNLFIQDSTPSTTETTYMWIQTGLGASGTDCTFWVEDGT